MNFDFNFPGRTYIHDDCESNDFMFHITNENSLNVRSRCVTVEVRYVKCTHNHDVKLLFSSRSWFLRSSSTFFVSWARTSTVTGRSCLPWPRSKVSAVVMRISSWRRRISIWTSEPESARRRRWILLILRFYATNVVDISKMLLGWENRHYHGESQAV